MPVDNDELQDLLFVFPSYELRRIIDERNIQFKSNKKEELVGALLEDEWSEEEVTALHRRYQQVNEETSQLGYYFCVIESAVDLEQFCEELLENEANFDNDGDLIGGGYDIVECTDSRLEGTRWRRTVEREYDRLTGEVQKNVKKSPTGFIIDLDDERVYIETNNYQKAKGIRKVLVRHDFELGEIGHKRELPENANQLVDGFVSELEQKLSNVEDQMEDVE